MDLEPIRQKIDQIDKKLVEMLNERLTLAAEIGKLKRSAGGQIYVAEREDAVLRKVAGQNQGPIKNEALRAIYREIMSAAIALEKPLLIAYLGPEATNTHAAAMKKFGASVDYHAMSTIADIFTAVEKGEKVYSKDQAIAQCRHWLQRHLPHAQLIDASSTSRAVQIAKDTPGTAA